MVESACEVGSRIRAQLADQGRVFQVPARTKDRSIYQQQHGPRGRSVFANSRVAVLFLIGHEPLNHLVPPAGEAVQAAGGDGSTQLVERQRGAEIGSTSEDRPFIHRISRLIIFTHEHRH